MRWGRPKGYHRSGSVCGVVFAIVSDELKDGEEMSWEFDQDPECDLASVVQKLIAQTGNSQRILECYYWSQEPGLLELMRAFLAMPADAQATLRTFLAAAVVRSSITASVDASGALTFRSPEAASLLASLFGHDQSAPPRYLS